MTSWGLLGMVMMTLMMLFAEEMEDDSEWEEWKDDVEAGGRTEFDEEVSEEMNKALVDDEDEKNDLVWEAMMKTAWEDYIHRLNRDQALYGVQLDPLELGLLLEEDGMEFDILGYSVLGVNGYCKLNL